jgi:hypothetical protein
LGHTSCKQGTQREGGGWRLGGGRERRQVAWGACDCGCARLCSWARKSHSRCTSVIVATMAVAVTAAAMMEALHGDGDGDGGGGESGWVCCGGLRLAGSDNGDGGGVKGLRVPWTARCRGRRTPSTRAGAGSRCCQPQAKPAARPSQAQHGCMRARLPVVEAGAQASACSVRSWCAHMALHTRERTPVHTRRAPIHGPGRAPACGGARPRWGTSAGGAWRPLPHGAPAAATAAWGPARPGEPGGHIGKARRRAHRHSGNVGGEGGEREGRGQAGGGSGAGTGTGAGARGRGRGRRR